MEQTFTRMCSVFQRNGLHSFNPSLISLYSLARFTETALYFKPTTTTAPAHGQHSLLPANLSAFDVGELVLDLGSHISLDIHRFTSQSQQQ